MNRRIGPSFLFVSLLALFVMPSACWSAPQVAADAAYAKKIQAILPPKVECGASSLTVQAGQSVTLTAEVQGASTGLAYSFSSSSGKLYPNGRTARLDTAGVAVGTVISATCQVVDGLGRRSSGDVAVRVVGATAFPVARAGAARPPTAADKTAADLLRAQQASMSQAQAKSAKSADEFDRAIRDSDSRPRSAAERANTADPYAQDASNRAAASTGESSAGPSRAPASVTVATPTPASSSSAAAGGGDPYQESEQVLQWKSELKNGKIDYLIPAQMQLHETVVVKVVVHGYADASQKTMAGATTGTLKVSPRMQVQLTAEDNPDEFEIDPKVGAILPVPIDGSATWMWNVVPKQPAKNQTLTVRALLVYPGKDQQTEQAFPSYTATVSVSVPGFWESLREDFWNDPTAVMKYLLPGGAGFTALAGLVVWWWKRRHPAEAKVGTKPDDDA